VIYTKEDAPMSLFLPIVLQHHPCLPVLQQKDCNLYGSLPQLLLPPSLYIDFISFKFY
jgi:hypothetical protein